MNASTSPSTMNASQEEFGWFWIIFGFVMEGEFKEGLICFTAEYIPSI